MSWFLPLKLLHVLAAITALGSNVTYAVWLHRADPDHVAYVIRGIRRLDRRLANPAYAVLLLTGLLMVATGAFSLALHWIQAALVLYVLVALLGIAVFAPAIRRQLREADVDPTSDAYRAAERTTVRLAVVTTAVVVVIVVLMVTKPI